MAMTLEQARQAIITRMQGFTGIDQERIQYPNAPNFNAPQKGLWCRLTIAGGSSFISGIADQPCTRRTGNIIIQCFDRLHSGEKNITELSEALLNHFEYYNADHLECLQGQSINVGRDNDFIQFNISISYSVN
ncbi:hypothetical protein [Acinetobacter gyllenbergii]|uniref:hypothetical protein n=1 Tax=Acinetobacter gyllenbergii TaxID=134534 RepID=UPI000806A422|nr:hypothetical protein [Acinetobacter gyllenbergii]OBY75264.1 prophage PSSB64-02 [Acinetobacter gyllenbergii]